MKVSYLLISVLVVWQHSTLSNSSPLPADDNGLGDPNQDYDGPKDINDVMPGRHLTSQEIRNLIYIAQENDKLRLPYKLRLSTSKPKLNPRKKRFIFPRNRNHAAAWIRRRQDRIRLRTERRRLRNENFIRRQQLSLQRLNLNAQRLQHNQNQIQPIGVAPLRLATQSQAPLFPLFPLPLAFLNPPQAQVKPYVLPSATSKIVVATSTTKAPTTSTTTTSTTAAPPNTSSGSDALDAVVVADIKTPAVTFVQAPLPDKP